jgi:hypothetical protein
MNHQISNPFSTGGGGTTFEQMVGTHYLVSLLASDIPRGLSKGICHKVSFQQRWSDVILDDIVVTSRLSNGSEHKLMLQVKHDITVSLAPSNKLFRRVIHDCWETFISRRGDFDPDKDRLGIAVGVYNTRIDKHFQSLLQWARTSTSVEEFSRYQTTTFASDDMREYHSILGETLSDMANRTLSDIEIWRFLKCFVYIHFDIENEGSRDQRDRKSVV